MNLNKTKYIVFEGEKVRGSGSWFDVCFRGMLCETEGDRRCRMFRETRRYGRDSMTGLERACIRTDISGHCRVVTFL